jgi:hypothetical protein
MATMTVKDAAGADVSIEKPLTPGRAVAANSRPVTLSDEDFAVIDGLETLLTTATTSLSIMDDWDESDRAKVNIIAGQVGVAAGAGAVSALTIRTVTATDDVGVASLAVIDDWDEGDRAKVNLIVGQAGIAAGTGVDGVTVPRVSLATNVALPAGTNNIGDVDVLTLPALPAGTNNIGDVDVLTLPALPAGTNNIGDVDVLTLPALVAGTALIGKVGIDQTTPGTTNLVSAAQSGTWNVGTVTTVTAVTSITNALPAGTNAIGKLAANSGVDIGDVDVTSLPALAAGTNMIGNVTPEGTEYETVAASQTAQVLGPTGGTGDYIAGVLIIPATTSPGNVLLLDNATSITIFTGGATSVSNLVPFFVPLGIKSVSGAWKITTGANVSCIGIGNFT